MFWSVDDFQTFIFWLAQDSYFSRKPEPKIFACLAHILADADRQPGARPFISGISLAC